jgi:isochorismate synthase
MITSDSFDIQDIKIQNKLLHVCLERRIPFVSYQKPGEADITTLVQHTAAPRKLNSILDLDAATGFVVAPFYGSEAFPAMLLEPDFICYGVQPVDEVVETLKDCNTFLEITVNADSIYQATAAEFTAQVEAIRTKIKDGVISKAVLSRIKVEDGVEGINLVGLFDTLCRSYPNAFVYILQMPGVGCWIGASPEPLVLIEDGRARTTSIAGTQVLSDGSVSDITWKEKETDEQEIVTGYIDEVLGKFGATNVVKTGPASYQAGNLVHLKTQFDFDSAAISPVLGQFVDALQPTPSVCGLPKAEAKDVVLSVEKHNREYYSGFLGPVNIDQRTALFVNLRCMKVLPEGFAFFIGAGITEGSIPGREWEETSHKMMTLFSVVNGVKTTKAYEFSKTGN